MLCVLGARCSDSTPFLFKFKRNIWSEWKNDSYIWMASRSEQDADGGKERKILERRRCSRPISWQATLGKPWDYVLRRCVLPNRKPKNDKWMFGNKFIGNRYSSRRHIGVATQQQPILIDTDTRLVRRLLNMHVHIQRNNLRWGHVFLRARKAYNFFGVSANETKTWNVLYASYSLSRFFVSFDTFLLCPTRCKVFQKYSWSSAKRR